MIFILAFVFLSVLALGVALVGREKTEAPQLFSAIALCVAAALAGLYAAVLGQFAGLDVLILPFGLATGLAAAAGAYYFWRAQEEKSLAVEPWHLPVVLIAPVLLSLLVFDSTTGLTSLKAVGLGVGVVALLLVALSAPRSDSELSSDSRLLGTMLVLFLVALTFIGLQLFAAILLGQNNEGVFLLLFFGSAGVASLLLGFAKRQTLSGAVYNHGALTGLFAFGALVCLLLSLKELPGWEAYLLAAAGSVVLGSVAAFFRLQKRPAPLGLVGLVAATAAALLVWLA